MRSLGLLALALFAGSLAADDDKKTDEDALLGTWRIEKIDAWKGAFPPGFQNSRLTFEKGGKTKHIGSIGDVDLGGGTWKIDAKAKPKTIDLLGEDKDKIEKGIYELNGDTLKLAAVMGDPNDPDLTRPTAFKADSKKKVYVFTLKRVKETKK